MWSKRFSSLMRQNGIKFGRDWKVEFKKSFKRYRQILVKVLINVDFTFVHLVVLLTWLDELMGVTWFPNYFVVCKRFYLPKEQLTTMFKKYSVCFITPHFDLATYWYCEIIRVTFYLALNKKQTIHLTQPPNQFWARGFQF